VENSCPSGIPKHSAYPWKKIWENLTKWDDIIKNKNRMDRAVNPVQQGFRELGRFAYERRTQRPYLAGDFNRAGGPHAIDWILSSHLNGSY